MLYFFFFKQKTAYEMRISDWSSDVCSSDLGDRRGPGRRHHPHHQIGRRRPRLRERRRGAAGTAPLRRLPAGLQPRGAAVAADRRPRRPRGALTRHPRSEEHTSELQSLMRISYAVFCLKKKNEETYNTD